MGVDGIGRDLSPSQPTSNCFLENSAEVLVCIYNRRTIDPRSFPVVSKSPGFYRDYVLPKTL